MIFSLFSVKILEKLAFDAENLYGRLYAEFLFDIRRNTVKSEFRLLVRKPHRLFDKYGFETIGKFPTRESAEKAKAKLLHDPRKQFAGKGSTDMIVIREFGTDLS